ncbi:MAG: integration host factor, partial [Coriobacteriales bacterium]|nr:integration host factor [Coriobacteriales bacterium]
MALPQLSDEARKEALKKAAAARSARAALRAQVKSGELSFADVLAKVGDPVVDKIKVITLIESLPGYGKAKAAKLLT